MKIGSIGYNYAHDRSFVMDRPCGVGCWLLLLVKSTAVFTINGREQRVRANSLAVLSPTTPVNYRAGEDGYKDDWIYFDMEQGEQERFAALGLKTDAVTPLPSLADVSELVRALAFEYYSAGEYREEICRHYSELLLLRLSRLVRSGESSSARHSEKHFRLAQLRAAFFTQPETVRSVDDMAQDMGLSRSGFQHLYKRVFGVSVMEDVIRGRVEYAERLLASTALSVREISERCGYSSEYVFMRQFKKTCGQTPSEYRKNAR
ncbi:MAG: helix-turn-helix domain-containing protein [Oscillospiraceae bacterium]